jgi:hypothetical protein
LKLVYSENYAADIGDHPWMTGKYAETLRQLTELVPAPAFTLLESPMADDQDILLSHTLTIGENSVTWTSQRMKSV